MRCHEFELVLEERDAGQLSADAAAHLNDCGQCRALLADLSAIQVAAREMAADEAGPSERVWHSLRAQLQAEGLIRTDEKVAHGGWLSAWLGLMPRPALAGVYLAFLVAAAVLIGTRGDLGPRPAGPSTPAVADATVALNTQLNTVERRAVSSVKSPDPAVNASLRKNLNIVDNFIALCEKSVREDPQNELAREYLYGAYQQKADLLATMVDRGATGDE